MFYIPLHVEAPTHPTLENLASQFLMSPTFNKTSLKAQGTLFPSSTGSTHLEYHSSFAAQLNITPITKTEENFQSFLVVFVI